MNAGGWQPGKSLAQIEKESILAAYQFYGHNKEMTARALGISTKTIYNKIEQYEGRISESQNEVQDESQEQLQAGAGQRLEPSTEVPQKRSVSLRKRKEV